MYHLYFDQMDQKKIFKLSDNSSYTTWSYPDFTVFSRFRNAKQMPDAVREAMEWVIETQGAMSTLNAQQYVKQMEKSRRFQIEAWA